MDSKLWFDDFCIGRSLFGPCCVASLLVDVLSSCHGGLSPCPQTETVLVHQPRQNIQLKTTHQSGSFSLDPTNCFDFSAASLDPIRAVWFHVMNAGARRDDAILPMPKTAYHSFSIPRLATSINDCKVMFGGGNRRLFIPSVWHPMASVFRASTLHHGRP